MGNQKQKWTQLEEATLIAGVRKHGPGKWKNILRDPEFAPHLTSRSNIDLKYLSSQCKCTAACLVSICRSLEQDKWRNINVSTAERAAKQSRMPKSKPMSNDKLLNCDLKMTEVNDLDVKTPQDAKNGPKYNTMILEAISSTKDPNGSDLGAIVGFIEQRHNVPKNFRRLLSSKLRRLVLQGKVEKVQSYYKIKDAALGVKRPTSKQRNVWPSPVQNSGLTVSTESVWDAAMTAAYKVAEAENKSFVAAEAVKEAERVAKMAEDSKSVLQLVMEIYEQCSRGDLVLLA